MLPVFLLVALAGVVLLFFRRPYALAKRLCQPRVVVKGHTFSDCVVEETIHSKRVEEVRRVCALGTGGDMDVSVLTALVLADRNPDVQFDVVDRDVRRIAAWNSDCAPTDEPGVDALLFDEAFEVKDDTYSQEVHRKRRLQNVLFSTDAAGCIAGADMIFLSGDMDMNTLRTIAQVSTGHKIIVYKGQGSTKAIRKKLDKAPTASFDIVANPDFLVPGSVMHDLLYPSRVVIGNLPGKHSIEAATLLRKLYAWIPPERILTTDVWSAELGRIATNALLAQQNATVHALSVICSRTDANGPEVSQIVAADARMVIRPISRNGVDEDSLWKDVNCLIYLSRELGLLDVAEYWQCVMRISDAMNHCAMDRVSASLPNTIGMVAMLGFSCTDGTMASVSFVQTLLNRGIPVHIYDPFMRREDILTTLGSNVGVEVMDDLEKAVYGCNAVVLHTDRGLGHDIEWQIIAELMQQPRFFLDPYRVMGDMEQYGFQMGEYGNRGIDVV